MNAARPDAGQATLEAAILTPVVFALLALVVFAGRLQGARLDVAAAARSAARTLSLARDPEAGVAAARRDTALILTSGDDRCPSPQVAPRVSSTEVKVTVTCRLDLADLAGLPVPGTLVVTATATEPRDLYREYSP